MALETLDVAVLRHLKLRLGRMMADYGGGGRVCLNSEDIHSEDVAGTADLMPTSGRPIALIVQRDAQLIELQPPIYRRYFTSDGTLAEVKAVARVTQLYTIEFQCTVDDKCMGKYGHELIRCLVTPRRFAYQALTLTTALENEVAVLESVSINAGNAQRRALERYRPTGDMDPMGQALYTVEQVGAMWTVDVEARSHIIEASSQKAMAGVVVTELEVESGS